MLKKIDVATLKRAKILFLSRVKKLRNGCWLWLGPLSKDGYGRVGGLILRVTKQRYAHRAAWVLFVGLIPIGLFILHHCDNPQCVRWIGKKHLFRGTQKIKVDDMISKKRHSFGAKHSFAVVNSKKPGCLSKSTITTVFKKYKSGKFSMKTLAKLSSVSVASVFAIVNFKGRYKFLKEELVNA